MPVPCYNCPERAMGCHASCDKYDAFSKERAAMREARFSAKEFVSFLLEERRMRARLAARRR